ncbi:centriole and centriolar satellite protein ofd1 isoform X2 [Antennarius striatus]|uniref:centriole and centriolar satellite protein ofd1 isoform X2 n=1 Tax=Antennarius striatus TaxID=241820 RepID=UPI0035B1C50E
MTSTKEDTLSPDELRKRLYQTFKNKGMLDTLKTQLRNQLIHELKQPSVTGGEPVPRPVRIKSHPSLVLACNNIVADHLRSSQYEYTLSVFYPESGLCRDKVAIKDLLHLLNIHPQSDLYRCLSSNKDDKGFLINLLTQLTHLYAQKLCHDADTQTAIELNYGDSLVEKMKMIDKAYENFSYSGDRWFSFESKLDAFRKDTEVRLEAEMNAKMLHFKDFEIAKVRMEEKANFQKEFDKMKQELERTYEVKAKSLMDREKNAIDRLQKQQEIEEKNVYMQRQSVLKEIETLRNRENEFRIRMESFEKTCQIHEEKVKNIEELLRRRELAVKTMEDTHDHRLKNELSKYQLELKEDFIKRTEKLTENENRNKDETARIQKEAAVIDDRLEEHRRACSELTRLQVELDTTQQQASLLTQQNELLRERLETMSDYSTLKSKKAEQQGQLRLLRKQLEEAQETNRLLHEDLGKPSKEQLALQMELRRLQSAHKLEMDELENQKQVLQAQLQSEVERCAQLSTQLIENEEQSQWMNKHVQEIKTQLRQTQQALENEVLRNPKPSLVDRSVLELSANKLVPPDIYMNRALLKSRAGCDDVCEAGGSAQERKLRWFDSPDTKARIQELQREAETLEEAYKNHQQRAVHSTVTHKLHTRPMSPHQAHTSYRPDSPLRKHKSHLPPSRSSHKSKISFRPLSPKNIRGLSSDTCNTGPPAQPRATLSQDTFQPQKATVSTDHSLYSVTEPLFQRDGQHKGKHRAPSAPPSASRNNLRKDISEEAAASQMAFLKLSPDRKLPCAPPQIEVGSSDDLSSELSSPHSPQMKSTTRDQSSPAELQPVLSTAESSPQPEKISLQDLTGICSEPSHIPELLLDTVVALSEEAPNGPTSPHPPRLPGDAVDLHGGEGESPPGEDAEDEEQRWKREQKERQERRERAREEAREREQQELERLEKEMRLKEEDQQAQEEEEEEDNAIKIDEEQKEPVDKHGQTESKEENPLEKYMKMVLESREKQQTQTPAREERQTSPEAKSLFDEKDDSIAADSHKDEDDDFW